MSRKVSCAEFKLKTMKKTQNNKKAGLAREEFIKVESNVYLHVTDGGEGPPVVLIHGP
jgi:hypothetical protein